MKLELFIENESSYSLWDREHDPDHPVAEGVAGSLDGAALLASQAVADWVAGFGAFAALTGMDAGEVTSKVTGLAGSKRKG